MLGGFIDRWNQERPPSGGRFSAIDRRKGPSALERTDATTMGPLKWLAAESGVPAGTIENVVEGKYATTELRIADPLVMAIDQPEAFHNDTLTVRPNPLASRAARARCCSGSDPA